MWPCVCRDLGQLTASDSRRREAGLNKAKQWPTRTPLRINFDWEGATQITVYRPLSQSM